MHSGIKTEHNSGGILMGLFNMTRGLLTQWHD